VKILLQQALDFGGAVEPLPVLAAKQDVVCNNRPTPDSRLLLSIEV
jgi:hypothetical protein